MMKKLLRVSTWMPTSRDGNGANAKLRKRDSEGSKSSASSWERVGIFRVTARVSKRISAFYQQCLWLF
jgi:hypothetical protein